MAEEDSNKLICCCIVAYMRYLYEHEPLTSPFRSQKVLRLHEGLHVGRGELTLREGLPAEGLNVGRGELTLREGLPAEGLNVGRDPLIRDRKVVLLMVLVTIVTVPLNAARCDKERMTYERSQGYRLPDHILQRSDSYLSLEQTSQKDCYSMCSADEQCFAYLLDHENNTCVLSKVEHSSVREQLVSNYAWSYHRKICITGLQCNRQWSFDRIPGSQLIGYDDKTVAAIGSEDLCLEACVTEQGFTCRSAQYNHATKYCVLSKYDRRTAAEAFRSSSGQVDYLENQCVQEPRQCHFHLQKDRTIIHSHAHVDQSATTRDQCKQSCLQHGDFRCRSFVFDLGRKLCLLTPEDSYSIAEKVIMPTDGRFEFYELGSCIEVKMRCESTTMTAVLKVATPFRGKIYSVGHPRECFAATATDSGEITLTIPLHGTKCGTKNLGNGTFTNSVVIQHHPYILRNSDRRIDVACDYEEIRTRVRGGKEVTEGEFQSLTQVVTGLVPTPGVRLRVVNSTGTEIRGAELGEPLYLRVEMLDNSVFGISGSGLVARSGEGSDMILLIDDYG
ncbi:uncharacterized protein LOC106461854, partial [Limulus polyphemus]|uniref:Uncharacterized protein LOC106461854 n=1 Tax=Limulus polyphemus TaxID=6850 RepID=A0ABM1SLY0_LIMPO